MGAIATWEALRDVALSLGLPQVEDAVSWGNPKPQGPWQDVVLVVALRRCRLLQG